MNEHVTISSPTDPIAALISGALDLEQRLLGSLIMHPPTWAMVCARVKESDFGEVLHQMIFAAIAGLAAQGKSADIFSVKTAMGEVELPHGVNLQGYIARLAAEAALPALAPQDADLIHEFGQRREMILLARAIERDAGDMRIDRRAAEIANDALGFMQAIVTGGADDTRRSIGESAGDLLEYIRAVRAKEIQAQAVTTGFSDVDQATGGYEAGTLWVIGARPGVGKTVLLVSSSLKVARAGEKASRDGQGFGAIAFSLEVPEKQITARYLSDLSYRPRHKIEFGRIARGHVDDEEAWCLEDAKKRLDLLPLTIDVAPRLTVTEIAAKVRSEKARMAKRGIRLAVVFIDYLKFIKASDRYKGQRVYEVGEISASLKELAKQEGLCVVLLAQLNRALESRDDKRPGLSDLRESGDLEADADVVAFLHREAYHIEKSPEYRKGNGDATEQFLKCQFDADLILGKNRAGPTPSVPLWCDVSCSTMTDKATGAFS